MKYYVALNQNDDALFFIYQVDYEGKSSPDLSNLQRAINW